MRGTLRAYGVDDRQVILADSFQGLPPTDVERYPLDANFGQEERGRFAVSLEDVRRNFANYDLLDAQVEFVEGWFSDSLPLLTNRTLAVLSSTMPTSTSRPWTAW